MMRVPLRRSSATTSFIRGAISATRAAAETQWWSSHMSQMMMAALFGSHGIRTVWELSTPSLDEVRERVRADSSITV